MYLSWNEKNILSEEEIETRLFYTCPCMCKFVCMHMFRQLCFSLVLLVHEVQLIEYHPWQPNNIKGEN